jgi:hypothetical protein
MHAASTRDHLPRPLLCPHDHNINKLVSYSAHCVLLHVAIVLSQHIVCASADAKVRTILFFI